jgi:hypothetical protein
MPSRDAANASARCPKRGFPCCGLVRPGSGMWLLQYLEAIDRYICTLYIIQHKVKLFSTRSQDRSVLKNEEQGRMG